tara:strand:- start:283 stop:447 length:165 start_codon:yes stop_codon:yes gene_type:complete
VEVVVQDHMLVAAVVEPLVEKGNLHLDLVVAVEPKPKVALVLAHLLLNQQMVLN